MLGSVSNNPTDTEPSAAGEAGCPPSGLLTSVCVQHEAGEGAVLVVVAPVRLPTVQFDVDLVPGFEVKNDAVACVVVVLVGVLGDGTGSHLKDKYTSVDARLI